MRSAAATSGPPGDSQSISGGTRRRHAASSVAPICRHIDAPCVLAWRPRSLARNTRPSPAGPLVVPLQDAEVELADRLIDQAPLILVVERLAGDLLGRDEAQFGHLRADHLERAPGLGVDLALRLLHPPLPVDLGLFLDALLHRLAHLA